MINFFYLLICLLLMACSGMNQSNNLLSNISEVDSNLINELIEKDNTYEKHFMVNLETDSLAELIIVSKSSTKSACLSPMYDTACVYTLITLYIMEDNSWQKIKSYQLPDYENTSIKIDSFSNLIVTQFSKHSGYSNQKQIETYSFRKGDFYLNTIFLFINTESGHNSDKEEWEYAVDLEKREAKLNYYSFVFKDMEEEEDHNIGSIDSTIIINLPKIFTIKLAEEYEFDTIVGEKNIIYSY